MRTHEELRRMTERFEKVLRDAGVKLTPQRLAIYRETARTGDHPTIETIYRHVRRKMPGLSLDTVYRTLDVFRELGLVTTIRPFPDRVRFDANMSPHHHFICRRCGATRDFDAPGLNALEIPKSARALGCVESAHLEVRGVCPACANRKNTSRTIGTRSHRPLHTLKEKMTWPKTRKP